MAKTVRTSISVPLELRARMDAVDEPVNWSAVACQAIEAKIAEIITRKGVKKMEDVVTRLRASKAKAESERYTAGWAAGEEWAKGTAEAGELAKLEALADETDIGDWMTLHGQDANNAWTVGESLALILLDEGAGRREAGEFWQRVALEDGAEEWHAVPQYVHGFAEGALNVWRTVKDQL